METKLRMLPPLAVLTFGDSREVEVQKLGRGRYTTAWRSIADPTTVYLQVREGENSKELLSRLAAKHIPVLERVGTLGDCDLYKSRYYSKLTAKSGEAWRHFRALQKHIQQAHIEQQATRSRLSGDAERARQTNDRFQFFVEEDETLPDSLREAIVSIVTWAASYTGYLIEICAKNLAVDSDGALILLDPIFDLTEVLGASDRARRERAMARRAF